MPARFCARTACLRFCHLQRQIRWLPTLEPVELVYRDSIFRPGEPMPDVYFPLSGLVSLVVGVTEGVTLETGMVGREGMTPLVTFLGVNHELQQGLIQAEGRALRLPVDVLREQAREAGPLRELLERYIAASLIQTTQTAACNGLHPIGQRLARWLLLAQDRIEADRLPMTQEFLALLLGIRRASVTSAAAILQRTGLIRSHYGTIEILNRTGLEEASCDCYSYMRRATERVFATAHG